MSPGPNDQRPRRLRLHALIRRIPGTHRYHDSAQGLRIALFFTRTHARLLRPKLVDIFDPRSSV